MPRQIPVVLPVFITCLIAVGNLIPTAQASDHDDGVSSLKTQALNLTDLYAFREDNQSGSADQKGNLVLVMNSLPRALPRQQYYFSTDAVYEFHLSRVQDKNAAPTGSDDIRVQFQFGEPDETDWQPITVSLVRNGQVINSSRTASGEPIRTTNLKDAETPHINQLTMGGSQVTVFAGLREDPFFLDVEQFFRVRAGAAGLGPQATFRPAAQAVDFTSSSKYNVNSIVARIPISLLQGAMNTPAIFDIWETISVRGQQVERLARPVINEGLVISNDLLNAFNMIPPSQDMSPAAAPVLAEASRSIEAFDMLDGKDDMPVEAVVTAFLPDVMRIDTSVDIAPGKPAYNADLSGDKGILTGGRKLEDDVFDITASFLVAKDPTGQTVKDNVSYAGTPGNPAQPGHKPVLGQFPYVPTPN